MVKNNKRLDKTFIILVLAVSILLVILFYLIYPLPVEQNNLSVVFEVGDKIGLDTSSENLNFGRVIPGTIAQKEIFIENNFKFPIIAEIYVEDTLKEFLFSPSKGIFVAPGNKEKRSFYLKIPQDSNLGIYEGSVRLKFFRV